MLTPKQESSFHLIISELWLPILIPSSRLYHMSISAIFLPIFLSLFSNEINAFLPFTQLVDE